MNKKFKINIFKLFNLLSNWNDFNSKFLRIIFYISCFIELLNNLQFLKFVLDKKYNINFYESGLLKLITFCLNIYNPWSYLNTLNNYLWLDITIVIFYLIIWISFYFISYTFFLYYFNKKLFKSNINIFIIQKIYIILFFVLSNLFSNIFVFPFKNNILAQKYILIITNFFMITYLIFLNILFLWFFKNYNFSKCQFFNNWSILLEALMLLKRFTPIFIVNDNISFIIVITISLILIITNLVLLIYRFNILSNYYKKKYIEFYSIYLGINIISLVGFILSNFNVTYNMLVMFIYVFLIYLIIWKLYEIKLNNLFKLKFFNSKNETLMFVFHFYFILKEHFYNTKNILGYKENEYQEQIIKILGYVKLHFQSCKKLRCFCKTIHRTEYYDNLIRRKVDKNTIVDIDKDNIFNIKMLFVSFLDECILENNRSNEVFIFKILFIFNELKNFTKISHFIYKLKVTNKINNIFYEFIFYKINFKVENYINNYIEYYEETEKLTKMDIKKLFKIENLVKNLSKNMIKYVYNFQKFILYIKSEKFDLNKVFQNMKNIYNLKYKIEKLENKNIKIEYSPLINSYYIFFYKYILEDYKKLILYEKNLLKALEKIEAYSKKDIYFYKEELMLYSCSVIIQIGGLKDDLGEIKIINEPVEKLFGYKKKNLIKNNIKLLLPDSISKNHQQYLINYLNSTKDYILFKEQKTFGKHKNNNLFPISLLVKPFFIIKNCNFRFISYIQTREDPFGYIITDCNGIIGGIDEKINNFLKLDYNLIKNIPIQMFLPEMYSYYLIEGSKYNNVLYKNLKKDKVLSKVLDNNDDLNLIFDNKSNYLDLIYFKDKYKKNEEGDYVIPFKYINFERFVSIYKDFKIENFYEEIKNIRLLNDIFARLNNFLSINMKISFQIEKMIGNKIVLYLIKIRGIYNEDNDFFFLNNTEKYNKFFEYINENKDIMPINEVKNLNFEIENDIINITNLNVNNSKIQLFNNNIKEINKKKFKWIDTNIEVLNKNDIKLSIVDSNKHFDIDIDCLKPKNVTKECSIVDNKIENDESIYQSQSKYNYTDTINNNNETTINTDVILKLNKFASNIDINLNTIESELCALFKKNKKLNPNIKFSNINANNQFKYSIESSNNNNQKIDEKFLKKGETSNIENIDNNNENIYNSISINNYKVQKKLSNNKLKIKNNPNSLKIYKNIFYLKMIFIMIFIIFIFIAALIDYKNFIKNLKFQNKSFKLKINNLNIFAINITKNNTLNNQNFNNYNSLLNDYVTIIKNEIENYNWDVDFNIYYDSDYISKKEIKYYYADNSYLNVNFLIYLSNILKDNFIIYKTSTGYNNLIQNYNQINEIYNDQVIFNYIINKNNILVQVIWYFFIFIIISVVCLNFIRILKIRKNIKLINLIVSFITTNSEEDFNNFFLGYMKNFIKYSSKIFKQNKYLINLKINFLKNFDIFKKKVRKFNILIENLIPLNLNIIQNILYQLIFLILIVIILILILYFFGFIVNEYYGLLYFNSIINTRLNLLVNIDIQMNLFIHSKISKNKLKNVNISKNEIINSINFIKNLESNYSKFIEENNNQYINRFKNKFYNDNICNILNTYKNIKNKYKKLLIKNCTTYQNNILSRGFIIVIKEKINNFEKLIWTENFSDFNITEIDTLYKNNLDVFILLEILVNKELSTYFTNVNQIISIITLKIWLFSILYLLLFLIWFSLDKYIMDKLIKQYKVIKFFLKIFPKKIFTGNKVKFSEIKMLFRLENIKIK